MFEQFRKDLSRYHRQPGKLGVPATLRLILLFPGLQAMLAYRLGQWISYATHRPAMWAIVFLISPFYWLMTVYVRLAFDIHIEQSAEIGPGLYIGHFGSIQVRNCEIGHHCSIQHGVNIVSGVDSSGRSVIGNRVWIGAYAQIRGAVRIANRATISAGAEVTRDVFEDCLVMGNPARVVLNNYDNSRFN